MKTTDVILAEKIISKYGLEGCTVAPAQRGYRNRSYEVTAANGSRLNLILYKREPEILDKILAAGEIAGYLSGKGLPVRRLHDPRIAKLRYNESERYAALYNYLPGQTIPWEGYTRHHLKLLGSAMGQMHAVLREQGRFTKLKVDIASSHLELSGRIRQYLDTPSVKRALAQKLGLAVTPSKLADAEAVLSLSRYLPNKQALHMDFVRGNILFGPAEEHPASPLRERNLALTGIIDFEKAGYGHPVFDVARTLAFLLVDCKHKSADKVSEYFLFSGYQKRGGQVVPRFAITPSSRHDLLGELISFFLLHDFYKFLRHNPYESLSENEHFTRTRDILLERGWIKVL